MSLVLIRADASSQIGTGHIMRCLALAQACRECGLEVEFACGSITPSLESRLVAEKIDYTKLNIDLGSGEDADETLVLAGRLGAAWIVADGYHFGDRFQKKIKDAGRKLLLVDDYGHADYYYADKVLNQNVYADEGTYAKRDPGTRLLLGTKYALLRREFWGYRDWHREIAPSANKVLVTLGGADPDNVTSIVLKALEGLEVEGLEATVVIGGSNPHADELQNEIRKPGIRLVRDVTNMPELMEWADICIAAGGSTNWELAFMGLPSLTIIIADNQIPIAEKMNELGATINLGWFNLLEPDSVREAIQKLLESQDRRAVMSKLGRKLVDGNGGRRVAMELAGV